MPFFSIVTPTYNRAHMINATIQSVIRQTFEDWELVIVDDGSTDNTREVVDQLSEDRIRYIWQSNGERSAARNAGLEIVTGEFICFIDSDDIWHPDHLAQIYGEVMAHNQKPALYFTSWTWVLPMRAKDICFASPGGKNLVEYVIENQIAPSAACIHKSIGQQMKFNPALRINEDVEYFARVVSIFDLIQIPASSVDLIVHPGNTSGQTKDCITPQIEAMKLIFSSKDLSPRISKSFKRNTLENLKHRLIEHYDQVGEYGPMDREIISFLVHHPFAQRNKARWLLLLRHLPRPNVLKRLLQDFREAMGSILQ